MVVVDKLIGTAVVLLVFLLIWRLITLKAKHLVARSRAVGWMIAGILIFTGTWFVLVIWEVVPILTSTALLGVWFFFFMWYIKDLFFDSFFAGIKLTAMGKLKRGDRIKIMGEECTVEEIKTTETILKTSYGTMVVPNSKIAQDAIIYVPPEGRKPEQQPAKQPSGQA